MQHLRFKTNLHCDACAAKIKPLLDGYSGIADWKVDLKKDPVELEVKGQHISKEAVQTLLKEAGYDIVSEQSGQQGFWQNKNNWKRASFNTLNCLIGCSIGDFGMLIYLQAYHPETSISWQMILAIIAGLISSICLETIILKTREQFGWVDALRTAFGMSFISMVGMEIAMNATDFMITGANANFSDPMYWLAFLCALVAGFLAPLPYNYYKLEKYQKACH